MSNPFSIILFDGLGNRLFQLAFALNFAKKHNRKLFLKYFVLNTHSKNNYYEEIIKHLNLTAECDENKEMLLLVVPDDYLFKYKEIPSVTDKIPIYKGFFQSEKYFKENKDEIVDLLTPKLTNEEELRQKYPLLDNSYFIHVRRGDYLKSAVHSVNLENYFKKCIDIIGNQHFMICSDDLDWCREFFKDVPNKTFVEENEITTLWLMSKCLLGGVCSNSTFSWWGSYLNKNKNKNVFFPSKWLTHKDVDYYWDIYPENAIIIKC